MEDFYGYNENTSAEFIKKVISQLVMSLDNLTSYV